LKNSSNNFLTFTRRQLDLLDELREEIEKRGALSALDPGMPKINKRIDELSVKVLRFAFKNLPKDSRRHGEFIIEVPTAGGRLLPGKHQLEIKPAFGIFHPDLPLWAKDHFIRWIREHRAGLWNYDARNVLRETGIVGIETGMMGPPKELAEIERWERIKERVLELRKVKKEEERPRGIVIDEMLKRARQQCDAGDGRKKQSAVGKVLPLGKWLLTSWWKKDCYPRK
jgi:hypothetical protein